HAVSPQASVMAFQCMDDSGFYLFDVGGHLGSPRCYQPNGWVIGALGFFVVILVYLFLFFGFLVRMSIVNRLGCWGGC
ncbi:MAG: hypothetical protein ACTSX0_02540, partial [Promethearchaeota archaeon]